MRKAERRLRLFTKSGKTRNLRCYLYFVSDHVQTGDEGVGNPVVIYDSDSGPPMANAVRAAIRIAS